MSIAMSHPPHPNGGLGRDDNSSTINPMALNTPVQPLANLAASSPRGVKRRSRSPDETPGADYEEDKPRKRGRPPKSLKVNGSPMSSHPEPTPNTAHTPSHNYVQTPASSHHLESPTTTPTKTLKALPTVRDHTTDQVNPEGDEFIIREIDEAGEKKVAPNGAPLGGRQYRARIFHLPNRGDKLFMLATECAKVLSYRDSYLLFNKNRSLYKIIASQEEKSDMIKQEILPGSYRSRQIAVVSARSMYRQFGSRMIQNGRRVRDDYWEAKAIKQGFTEEDHPGEKRPGAGRAAREAQAAASETTSQIMALPHGSIMYQTAAETNKPVSYISLEQPNDLIDYSSMPRARQDIPPIPYEDRVQSSTTGDMLSQVTHAAEYNQSVSNQRRNRAEYLDEIWRTPHEPEASEEDVPNEPTTHQPATSQHMQMPGQQALLDRQQISHHPQPQPQQHHPAMMQHQAYPANMPHMMGQSPSRPPPQQLPGGQMAHPGMPGYAYPGFPGQMFPQGMQPGAHPAMQQAQPGMQFQVPQQSPHMQHGQMHPQMQQRNPQMAYNPTAFGQQPGQFAGQQQFMGQQGSPGGQQQYMGQQGFPGGF